MTLIEMGHRIADRLIADVDARIQRREAVPGERWMRTRAERFRGGHMSAIAVVETSNALFGADEPVPAAVAALCQERRWVDPRLISVRDIEPDAVALAA